MENYESATNYIAYIRRVEERYNDTMNAYPGCDYCTSFQGIKQKSEQFMAKLNSLVSRQFAFKDEQHDVTQTLSQGCRCQQDIIRPHPRGGGVRGHTGHW